MQAIERYARAEPVKDIEHATGANRRQLYRLLERALAPHHDGRIYGLPSEVMLTGQLGYVDNQRPARLPRNERYVNCIEESTVRNSHWDSTPVPDIRRPRDPDNTYRLAKRTRTMGRASVAASSHSEGGDTAVEGDSLSGQIDVFLCAQSQHRRNDFLGTAEALHRQALCKKFQLCAEVALGHHRR